MDEPFLQATLRSRVLLSGQPNQAILKDVRLQRVERRDHDIDPEIVLESPEQVGLRQIFLHEVAVPLGHIVLLAYHLDASAAAGCSRLEDIHVFVVVHLPVILESLVVLREDVRQRTEFEVLAVFPPLALDIPPEIGLAPDAPGSWEVIDLLELVHIL